MRRIISFALLLITIQHATAQNAVVEESLTDVECISRTHAIIRFKVFISLSLLPIRIGRRMIPAIGRINLSARPKSDALFFFIS